MIAGSLWWIALGPLALACVGLLPRSLRSATTVNALALGAALLSLALALGTAAMVALDGALRTQPSGWGWAALSLYLDAMSAAMFCLVSFVGAIVIAYSRNYLDGDPERVRFTKLLCLTLAAVLWVIVSGNLFSFTLAWIATSLGLNVLLVFYPERPAARLAARKKF